MITYVLTTLPLSAWSFFIGLMCITQTYSLSRSDVNVEVCQKLVRPLKISVQTIDLWGTEHNYWYVPVKRMITRQPEDTCRKTEQSAHTTQQANKMITQRLIFSRVMLSNHLLFLIERISACLCYCRIH